MLDNNGIPLVQINATKSTARADENQKEEQVFVHPISLGLKNAITSESIK